MSPKIFCASFCILFKKFHNLTMVNVMNIYDDYELNRLTLEDDFKDSSDFLLKEIITGI